MSAEQTPSVPLGDVALLYQRCRKADRPLPHREAVFVLADHYRISDEEASELVRRAKADGLIREPGRG